MKSEVSGTAGQQYLENFLTNDLDVDSCRRHVSVQTGEEFSPEFLRDRTPRRRVLTSEESSHEFHRDRAPRKVVQTVEECSLGYLGDCGTSARTAAGNVTDQHQPTRVGFQFNQTEKLVYEDSSSSSVGNKDPVNGTDFSDFCASRGFPVQLEKSAYSDATGRCHHQDCIPKGYHQPQQQSMYTDEIYNGQTGLYPTASLHNKSGSPHAYQTYGYVSGVPDGSFSGKMKFLCSSGGKILARPSDGKLRYVGGETRIISIRENLSYQELMKRTSTICNQPHTIKYQLPGEDLDALISVCSDEDFHHMIEEYHELEKGSQRLRIFLESLSENESPCSSDARSVQQNDNDYQYVVAVNGMTQPSLRKNSSRESLAGISTDFCPSFQRDSPNSVPPTDIGGESSNLTNKLPNPTVIIPTPINMVATYVKSPSSHMPVQFRDPVNPQVRVEHYENSYHVDAMGYHVNHTLDSAVSGNCQQLDRNLVESSQTCDEYSSDLGSIRESVHSFAHLRGHSDMDVGKPMLDESAIQPENFVTGMFYEPNIFYGSQQQSPYVLSDLQCQPEETDNNPSRQDMISSSMPRNFEHSPSFVHQLDTMEEIQTSECDGLQTIEASDLENQYAQWGRDMIKWTEKNNLNLTLDLKDPEDNQHIVSPATPLEKQHSIATTVSSDTVSNLSSGLQHATSLEMSRADMNVENPFLLTSDESDCILTSNFNENDPLVVVLNSANFAPIGSDVSLGESSAENLGERSLSQTSDDKNAHDMQESPVVIENLSDILPPRILSSRTALSYIHEKTSDGVLTPSYTENGTQSDSEDVEDDEKEKDGLVCDVTIAEMEAGIHGLQTIRNSDLEELQELGSGTFGTVYHGKWRGTDVAIKRIRKSCFAGKSSEQERLTKDFWREARILSKLHHPNVVALYGVVPDGPGGTLSTVTEYMANGSLRHVLYKKRRALDRQKKLIIAQDAAIGMEYLHLKNIVHFDLKCENLLVNLGDPQRPVCKVGDFGLSRIKRNSLVTGGARGTLPWIAPELLDGSSNRVSEKVDVFSFGIALWEILTGEEPYADMHCGAIIGGIVTNTLRPPIPKRCDRGWKALMEECWSHDPAERPSFTEIANKLQLMSVALLSKRQSEVKK